MDRKSGKENRIDKISLKFSQICIEYFLKTVVEKQDAGEKDMLITFFSAQF